MSETNTVVRSMHDLGLAAWFGGSLMGAVGLNGAAETEGDSKRETARIASAGWARWTPVNAGAIGVHLIGGAALLAVNASRVGRQEGVGASSMAKTVLTGAAMAATAYSRMLGKKVELASSADPSEREKGAAHPIDLDKAQRQLSMMQWAVPALTGGVVVLSALHGEQQRADAQARGMLRKAVSPLRRRGTPGAPAGVAFAALGTATSLIAYTMGWSRAEGRQRGDIRKERGRDTEWQAEAATARQARTQA